MKTNILALLLFCIGINSAYAVRCSDFSSQRQAQAYMERNNAYYLDRDRDGIACEHLR